MKKLAGLIIVSVCCLVLGVTEGKATSLLGYWAFEETSNPSANTYAIDSSGNGLDGIYQPLSGPGPNVDVSGPAGFGSAADFNGVNWEDEVYLGLPDSLKYLNNDFTITAWINPDQVTGVQRIFSSNHFYAGGGFGFGLNDTKLRFTTYNILDYDLEVNVGTALWTHVGVTFDTDNDATFFINGTYVGEIEGVLPASNAQGNFFIGSEGVIEHFDGRIDEVRIYSGLLTESDIYDLANTPVPEPSTILLLGTGVLGLFGCARRRQR